MTMLERPWVTVRVVSCNERFLTMASEYGTARPRHLLTTKGAEEFREQINGREGGLRHRGGAGRDRPSETP
jgi:hypothetical protein